MPSETAKAQYKILYRDLGVVEAEAIEDTVRDMRDNYHNEDVKNPYHVLFTQIGTFNLGETYYYYGYLIAFEVEEKKRKMHLDVLVKSQRIGHKDAKNLYKMPVFEYYPFIAFLQDNKYIGSAIGRAARVVYHGISLENVKGTPTEKRISKEINELAMIWSRKIIREDFLIPRLVNSIASYMSTKIEDIFEKVKSGELDRDEFQEFFIWTGKK